MPIEELKQLNADLASFIDSNQDNKKDDETVAVTDDAAANDSKIKEATARWAKTSQAG